MNNFIYYKIIITYYNYLFKKVLIKVDDNIGYIYIDLPDDKNIRDKLFIKFDRDTYKYIIIDNEEISNYELIDNDKLNPFNFSIIDRNYFNRYMQMTND